jgi:serine/threonine protein kinase
MAAVWRGHDQQLGREVAVKVISDSLSTEPSYVKRFQREARLAAGVSHPNLVQIHDVGTEDDRPFLVMEYVSGGTLADRLRDDQDRPSIDVERLAGELLGALARIHELGIVHRDIKPANILIGGDGRARLTDFGIAHSADMSSLTRTGTIIGTARYIAPEISRQQPASPQSDLYSLGRVLRETIGDDNPPVRLEHLIDALCQPDPQRRPSSAQEASLLLEAEPTKLMPTMPTVPAEPSRRRARIARPRRDIRRLSLATTHRTDGRLTIEIDRRVAILVAVLTAAATVWAIGTAAGERTAPAARLTSTRVHAVTPPHPAGPRSPVQKRSHRRH